jgi:hypothetical protein
MVGCRKAPSLMARAYSTMTAFEALNYTLLYAYGAMDALQIYQQIPDLVPVVILEGDALAGCVKRNAETASETDSNDAPGTWQAPDRIGCVKRPGFEEGIPVWKLFAFHFWPGPNSALGGNWTLSPEDYGSWMPNKGNYYLGKSPLFLVASVFCPPSSIWDDITDTLGRASTWTNSQATRLRTSVVRFLSRNRENIVRSSSPKTPKCSPARTLLGEDS